MFAHIFEAAAAAVARQSVAGAAHGWTSDASQIQRRIFFCSPGCRAFVTGFRHESGEILGTTTWAVCCPLCEKTDGHTDLRASSQSGMSVFFARGRGPLPCVQKRGKKECHRISVPFTPIYGLFFGGRPDSRELLTRVNMFRS